MSPNFDQQLQQGSEDAAELNRQVKALDQQLQQTPRLDLLKDIGPQANQGQPLSLPEVGKQQQYSNPRVANCENPPDECPENPTAVPSSTLINDYYYRYLFFRVDIIESMSLSLIS
jgi:hypothetical protein